MNYKNSLPSPYDYEKLGAYLHALVDAGAAHNITEARKLARRLVPSEAKIQKEILAYLHKEVGGFWWKDAAGPYQQKGIPDIVGCHEGHFFSFEVKRPLVGELSAIQRNTLAAINAAGGTAYVVTSVDDVRRVFTLPQNEKEW